jgi:hypothetical protein
MLTTKMLLNFDIEYRRINRPYKDVPKFLLALASKYFPYFRMVAYLDEAV